MDVKKLGSIAALVAAAVSLLSGVSCALNELVTGGVTALMANYTSCLALASPGLAVLIPDFQRLLTHATGGNAAPAAPAPKA
jgi:hypothetical protein